MPVDQDRAEELTAEGKEAARAKTQEYRERTKRYLEQKMPRDRRDQAIWRLKVNVIWRLHGSSRVSLPVRVRNWTKMLTMC